MKKLLIFALLSLSTASMADDSWEAKRIATKKLFTKCLNEVSDDLGVQQHNAQVDECQCKYMNVFCADGSGDVEQTKFLKTLEKAKW